MANCRFCGKPAGFLRSTHPECEEQNRQRQQLVEQGKEQILTEIARTVKNSESFDALEKKISEIEAGCLVPPTERKSLLLKGWENAADQALEDSLLTKEEEQRLADFRDRFGLSVDELDQNGALTKMAKAATLREVMNGGVPQKLELTGRVPINLQKGEQIVWAFPRCRYMEQKTRREYVGGSRGVSVRLAKGLYYRTSEFKGRSIEHDELVHVDTGAVAVTNKNLYFAGLTKSLRIPYAKIVSFQPYSDGIGILRDAASAKLQMFETGDGWFTYNLVTNLAKL